MADCPENGPLSSLFPIMSRWISHWSLHSFFPVLISFGLVACNTPQQSPGGTSYYSGNPPAAIPWNPQTGSTSPAPTPAPVDPYYIPSTPLPISSGAPRIRAESYLLIDARTGANLASVGADVHRSVASTQKLLTALVVLDAGNLDRQVRVAASDVAVEPTKLGIRPGEVYTRRQLLYAFLIKSCNDVANVLARDNAGSISAFAAKMNAKMRSLGGNDSNFRNPHGLTAPGQYSTARNMARVAMAAYRNQIIRDAVRRTSFTFRYASGKTAVLKSTNDLLGKMPECNGMKTGYTNAAGRCLISSASTGGRNVILVQLGTKTKYIWDDGRLLMSWGLRKMGARIADTGLPEAAPTLLAMTPR